MPGFDDWNFLIKSSDSPKELFTEIRRYYHYKVDDVLVLCDVSKNIYDRIMSNKKISKESALKICVGLKLDFFLMMKFMTVTGNYLNVYDFNDYKILKNYKKSVETSSHEQGKK